MINPMRSQSEKRTARDQSIREQFHEDMSREGRAALVNKLSRKHKLTERMIYYILRSKS